MFLLLPRPLLYLDDENVARQILVTGFAKIKKVS